MTYYTTAPRCYDGSHTTHEETTKRRDWRGRVYRKVSIDPPEVEKQLDAYESGNHTTLCPLQFNDPYPYERTA